MRILITGPSGFLGSALLRHWASQGHELWLLARPASSLRHIDHPNATVHVRRVAEPEQVAAIVKEAAPDAIVHTACVYGRKGELPLDILDANMRFGIALLQAVLTEPMAASSNSPCLFLNTGTVLTPNISLYALSKSQFSAWGGALAHQMPVKLQFVDIRLQHMYGPGDNHSKFTSHVVETCFKNKPYIALTEGRQRRDFIYIDDVVSAYDCILKNRTEFESNDEIDVGTGTAIEIRTYVETVKKQCRSSTLLDYGSIPYRQGEPMTCEANVDRLKRLGWSPRVSLDDGVASMIKELKAST